MQMERKMVLITGGSGFIGQHLVKKFVEGGQEVHVYDSQSSTTPGKMIIGDIFDSDKLKPAVAECDTIIHLVGLADAGIAQKEPTQSFRLNIESLQSVLEACQACGGKTLIFPSSAAVYGITDDLPIKESFPLKPTNIYSWHKYLCETLIRAYHTNYGLNFVILRLFNVYGKGNKGAMGIFAEKARKGETIESFGPQQYRDFIYVGDVAEALYKAAIYEKATNRNINIGSGQATQIRDILDLVCEIFPQAKWVEKKANFIVYDSIADITLAKILLDFEPHSSREFIKKIIMREMID
jgi:UDP-glucose 4-epimerase